MTDVPHVTCSRIAMDYIGLIWPDWTHTDSLLKIMDRLSITDTGLYSILAHRSIIRTKQASNLPLTSAS